VRRRIHTETVSPAHPYTSTEVPWEVCGKGLLRAHGRTVEEQRQYIRQRRMLVGAAVFWGCWALIYFA